MISTPSQAFQWITYFVLYIGHSSVLHKHTDNAPERVITAKSSVSEQTYISEYFSSNC